MPAHLEVDDDEEHQHRGQQVGDIGQILPVEGLPQSTDLISTRR